jgi:hypothetical protein
MKNKGGSKSLQNRPQICGRSGGFKNDHTDMAAAAQAAANRDESSSFIQSSKSPETINAYKARGVRMVEVLYNNRGLYVADENYQLFTDEFIESVEAWQPSAELVAAQVGVDPGFKCAEYMKYVYYVENFSRQKLPFTLSRDSDTDAKNLADVFGKYLREKKLNKPNDYGSVYPSTSELQHVKSAMRYIFEAAGRESEWTLLPMAGVTRALEKRDAAEKQQGTRKMEEGKQPTPEVVYKGLCGITLKHSLWGKNLLLWLHLAVVLGFNLCARISSTVGVNLAHFSMETDCLGVKFGHQKGDQGGKTSAYVRHIHDTLDPETSIFLALALFLLTVDQKDMAKHGKLFDGNRQSTRYDDLLHEILMSEEMRPFLDKAGISAKDLSSHSNRKFAAIKLLQAYGLALPTSYLRLGWMIDGVKDRYLKYDSAQDRILGRILAFFDQATAEFASLPPHFLGELTGDDLLAVQSCFGDLPLNWNPIRPFLFAALVQHKEWLEANLPAHHPIFSTAFWSQIDQDEHARLKTRVVSGLAQEGDALKPTGLPPIVVLDLRIREMQAKILKEVSALTAELQAAQKETLEGVAQVIREEFQKHGVQEGAVSPQMLTDSLDLAFDRFRSMLDEKLANLGGGPAALPPRPAQAVAPRPNGLHNYRGGFYRVPEDFIFPTQLSLEVAWVVYVCADAATGRPPFMKLEAKDLGPTMKHGGTDKMKRNKNDLAKMKGLYDPAVKALRSSGNWIDAPDGLQARAMWDRPEVQQVFASARQQHQRAGTLFWTTYARDKSVRRPKPKT